MKDDELRIMFISRGCGWGHAVPDIVIISTLLGLRPNFRVEPVSYSDGAMAYREYGLAVTDLLVQRHCSILDMIIACTRIIDKHRPHLIVAHEEYPAVVAAKAFGVPCLFLTDFFMDPSSIAMQSLQYASEVIYLGDKGLFTEPPSLRGRVHYVGRVVRPSRPIRPSRSLVRKKLGIPRSATVVLSQPGSWSEAQHPIADILASAWLSIPSPRHLVLIAGADYNKISRLFSKQPDVSVKSHTNNLFDYMLASDVLITKGSRQTVYEAASMGLPSISVSAGLNWPDDVVMCNTPSNLPLSTDGLTPEALADAIVQQAKRRSKVASSVSGGALGAARRIELYCDAVLSLPQTAR